MNDSKPENVHSITIIGGGSYGAVIAELAESCGYQVTSFLDDDLAKDGTSLDGVPVKGPIVERLRELPRDSFIAVAIGNNATRLHWLRSARDLGFQTPTLISPYAIVSPSAKIADAVYLHPGCHVWTQVRLGFGTIFSPHAAVAHHSTLDEGCFVAGGAIVGASIHVGDQAFFGQGSVTSTGVHSIAPHTLVGAGSVVIRDTEPYGVYAGNPAHILRYQDRILPGAGATTNG